MYYQIIIGTVIAFLASAGLIFLWENVQRFFLMPPQDRITMMVTSAGHDENLEYLIRSLVFKAKGLHARQTPVIIIVDEGMDEETNRICRKLQEEYGCLYVCKGDELGTMLRLQKV